MPKSIWTALILSVAFLSGSLPTDVLGQAMEEPLYSGLKYRNIGPFRGGRSAAVAGAVSKPSTYYMGATGGGVWRTSDGGQTWKSISDGFFGGSIGAVAVSEWDPNVIYVGGGEKTVRGNVSHGYGMWRSTDAGKSWNLIGLTDSRRIPRVRIHPRNPDLVYAAVLGHLFGPNEERGVYRSRDGGATWERILFVSNEAGAVDLEMDPTNPRVLYASIWRVRRTPYSLEGGGEGSGLWKSTDGGDTWTEITHNEGLPKGTIGISGVSVSPVDPERVYAIIEAVEGGVFRSDDAGETWSRVNEDRTLRQRAWYYTRIYAHPTNLNSVYVLNVGFWKSEDGGESFSRIDTPHGDHHDLWISSVDPNRMVVGDDGGAQVTFDGGSNWSTYHNQPTAQFYRVTTDNHFPYRIYGAQQDNSTVRIYHRSSFGSLTDRDWEPTAGGESGHIAPHPINMDIVYGGSYGGFLTRVNHATQEWRAVNVWPDNPMGHGAADLKYRFQWNFPILFSPHDPETVYAAGNVLFKTTNEGQSWQTISPDLTRSDTSKMGPSGGPITKDNTSIEYYGTIFAVVESPHEAGVIWAGSDDGLIHVTRDSGQNWENVTPSERLMPDWMQINSLEPHPTDPGGLYVAGTRYKLDDFRPYLYKTLDYGKTWTKISDGIDDQHFTRVIRSDPGREGLLYAGTESGMYVSFDDGESWKPFQMNLPIVPVTDLAVKENDLIVATQGRSFWVLDDLTVIHQSTDDIAASDYWLFTPRPSYRLPGFQAQPSATAGQNAPGGVQFRYYFKEAPDSAKVKILILEATGDIIATFSPTEQSDAKKIDVAKGMNEWTWNLRYEGSERFDGLILWHDNPGGPRAVPGEYQARLIVGEDSLTTNFTILKDPRSSATQADIQAQFDFLIAVRDKLSETHKAIKQIRDVRNQINDVIERAKKDEAANKELVETGESIVERITAIEKALYQTENKSVQDPLNFPIRLNNKLSDLANTASAGDFRPTDQIYIVRDEIVGAVDVELAKLSEIIEVDIPAFNQMVLEMAVPAVSVDQATSSDLD